MNENVITIQPINYDMTSEHTTVVNMFNELNLMSLDIDPKEVQYDLTNDKEIQKKFDKLRTNIELIYKKHQQMVLTEISKTRTLLNDQFDKDHIEKALQETLQKISFKETILSTEIVFSFDDLTKSSPVVTLLKNQSKYVNGVANVPLKKYQLLAHDWADKIIHHFQNTVKLFCRKSNDLITLKSFEIQKKGNLFNTNIMNNSITYKSPKVNINLPRTYDPGCSQGALGCFWYTNHCCSGFNTVSKHCCNALWNDCCCGCGCQFHTERNISFTSETDKYTRFSKTSLLSLKNCCHPWVRENEIANPLKGLSKIKIKLVLTLESIETPSISLKDFDSASLYSVSSLPLYDEIGSNLPSYTSLQPEEKNPEEKK